MHTKSRQPESIVPRPQFPQPQFERQAWLSLNGTWEFEFDDADAGVAERWYLRQQPFSRRILVPFCFESLASGIHDRSFHPVAWYRRTFDLPEAWRDQRILLKFGAVDYRARVWVNGLMAGEHEGGQTPFSIDITDLMAESSNVIVIRVQDPPEDRTIPRGKQYWKEKSDSIWYTRTSGVWQSVWLEAVGSSYLSSVRIAASPDGSVSFEPSVADYQAGLRFSAQILFQGTEVWQGSTSLRESCPKVATFIDECKLWSPDSPDLYDVVFKLEKDGRVLDQVDSYFGFRSIAVRDGVLYLNNCPAQLRFVLDQGYWPETLMTPPSEEAIQLDIRAVKEMGFNGVRKHQKVEDPRFLYWADRMGLLVSGEIGNAFAFNDDAVARLSREWTDVVRRDFNHPCIIMWIPINESWGVPNLGDSRQRNLLRAMYALTKTLDPTRLVIDNDGWEHTEATDLFGVHDYTPLGSLLASKYEENGPAFVPETPRPAIVEGAARNSSPLFLSEFGGVAFVPPRSAVPEDSWGYYGVENEYRAALVRIKRLLSEAVQIKNCVGFCYTQLADVEQEINGLLTYDRIPKFDASEIRSAMERPLELEIVAANPSVSAA